MRDPLTDPLIGQVLTRLDEEDFEPDTWGDYLHYSFESNVQEVASAIRTILQQTPEQEEFYFDWEGELEGGVVGANIGIYLGDSCYLHRWLELKRLTDNRDATGREQAANIASALLDAYDDVLRKRAQYENKEDA